MDYATESRIERMLMMERIRGASREDLTKIINQVYHTEEPAPRARNFTEWKAQKAAKAAGQAEFVTTDISGKVIHPGMPAWDKHLARDENLSPLGRAIRDGKVPRERIAAANREGARGWKALRAEFGGNPGNGGAAA